MNAEAQICECESGVVNEGAAAFRLPRGGADFYCGALVPRLGCQGPSLLAVMPAIVRAWPRVPRSSRRDKELNRTTISWSFQRILPPPCLPIFAIIHQSLPAAHFTINSTAKRQLSLAVSLRQFSRST